MTKKLKHPRRLMALVMAMVMTLTLFTACASSSTDPDVTEEEEDMTEVTDEETVTEAWLAAWGTSMQTVWSSDTIPSEATSGETVTIRQQIRPSVSGDELRFTLSNQYGSSDLVIDSMKIAMLLDPSSYEIDTDSEIAVTYEESTTINIQSGYTIVTDSVEFSYSALDDIAVSMEISQMPSTITLHRASRCTNWIIAGSHVSDNDWAGASTYSMWYFLAVMDIVADSDSASIVCLGDSLTDGASITENSFTRYTDTLMELMQADDDLNSYSIINMGVGGTPFLGTYDNSTGLGRVTRDIVNISGVKYCIVLMGVNDIGGATTDISADIIAGYESLVEQCHEAGIQVIGCTITPFNGSSYYSDLHEEIRQTVNEYIMSDDSAFDGYVDLASAVASESDSSKMDSSYVSVWNDYLHFNATGYGLLGSTIYDYLKDFLS